MDSEFLTFIIDAGTWLVNFARALVEAAKQAKLFGPILASIPLLSVLAHLSSISKFLSSTGIVKGFQALTSEMWLFGRATNVASASMAGLVSTLSAVAIGVVAAVAIYNKLHKDLDERIDAMNEAQEQVDELESQLTQCRDRIAEINSMDSLTVVEQDELNRLREEVALLEQELAVKNAILALRKEEVAIETRREANNILNPEMGNPNRENGVGDTKLERDIKAFQQAKEDLENATTDDAYNKAHAELLRKGEDLQEWYSTLSGYIPLLDPEKDKDLIAQIKLITSQITLLTAGTKSFQNVWDSLWDAKTREKLENAANAQAKLNEELHALYQGNVDITSRPMLRAGDFAQFDWNDFEHSDNSHVTLHSQTFLASDFGGAGKEAIVVTPILPNGEVFASQQDLEDYVAGLFDTSAGTFDISKDAKGITLGLFDSVEIADQYAIAAHNANKAFEDLWDSDDVQNTVAIFKELGKTLDINSLAAAFVTSVEKIAKSGKNAGDATKKFLDIASRVQTVNKALSSLAKVYDDVKDGGSFDFSSILNNTNFAESFGTLGEAYDEFIQIVSSSPDDIEKCQEAFNKLTTEYIRQSGVLDDVSEDTRDMMVAMLEQAGITNAADVIDHLIATEKALAETEGEVADKTWQQIMLLYQDAEASGVTAEAYARLAFQKAAANSATVQTQADVNNIYNLANAAYAGVEALRLLSLAKADFAQADTIAAMASSAAQNQDYETAQTYIRIANSVRERGQRYITRAGNVDSTSQNIKPFDFDGTPTYTSPGGGGGSSSKEVEEYIADIDKYYAALKRLESAKLSMADANRRLESTEDYNEKIRVTKEIIDLYQIQADAEAELIELRKQTIETESEGLRALGFEIEYNNKTNEFYVANLEHINDLTADSVGEYESLEEATNALRKETEDLIDSLDGLNQENQEGIESLHDLAQNAKEARNSIVELYDSIVKEANDVVDGFQNVYKVLTDAAKEYAQTGYLSVDSLQSILDLGPKYLAMLVDENGQLVINEQNLQAVIAAKTQDMAAETALSYAKQVLLATERGEEDVLRNLTDATAASSAATWDLAFATVGLAKAIGTANGLSEEYYDNAVSYLTSMQSLTETAVNSIPQYYETLKSSYISQADALDQVLKLTQDMLKWENQQAIDALNKQKDAYGDIINQKKELLKLTKEEQDHEKDLAEKIAEIAKLQARIDQLSLDDSREAQAQKRKLEEELAKLQKGLTDDQADYALDVQNDALDKQLEMYENEKDDEIAALEDSLNSAEKLYQAALHELETNYGGTIERLKQWNYECGNTLQQSLLDAIDAATAALDRFGGSFTAALEGVDSYTNLGTNNTSGAATSASANDIISAMRRNSITWWTTPNVGIDELNAQQASLAKQYSQLSGDEIYKDANGTWHHANGDVLYSLSAAEKDQIAHNIVAKMKANSAAWFTVGDAQKQALSDETLELAKRFGWLTGKTPTRDANGTWWLDGKKLYDIYHSGGIVGRGSFKQNEVLALLEKGEAVLDDEKQKAMYKAVDFVSTLAQKIGSAVDVSRLFGGVSPAAAGGAYASLFGRGAGVNGSLLGCNIERIDIVAPIQVVQKLDSEELKAHADMIGALSAQYIREGFTKRGVGANVTAL